MNNLTPREIVRELDRYIIGQDDAKKAVLLNDRLLRERCDIEGFLQAQGEPLGKNCNP